MPGVLEPLIAKGLRSVILFGVIKPEEKDKHGSKSIDDDGPVIKSIQLLKEKFPDLFVICDVCLCPYTDHGHCGLICSESGEIKNEKSVQAISQVAFRYACAGADCVAPSDCMDGRIGVIKKRF